MNLHFLRAEMFLHVLFVMHTLNKRIQMQGVM